MKVKYFPFAIKMYRGISKITIIVWEVGNVEASIEAKKKYPDFIIMNIQAQWWYKNRLIAI